MTQMFDPTFEPALNRDSNRDTCFPIFKIEAVEDKAESLKAGRKMYRDVAVVEIHTPGDKTSIPKHVVSEQHKRRWPQQWAAFERGQKMSQVGTPVDKWPLVGPAEAKMLKACDIETVEVLAEYPETNTPRIPGFMGLKAKARDWLASAAGNADAVRLGHELREALDRIKSLEERNAVLMRELERHEMAPEPRVKRKYTRRSATDLPGKHD